MFNLGSDKAEKEKFDWTLFNLEIRDKNAEIAALESRCKEFEARYDRIFMLLMKAQDRADRLLTKLEKRDAGATISDETGKLTAGISIVDKLLKLRAPSSLYDWEVVRDIVDEAAVEITVLLDKVAKASRR